METNLDITKSERVDDIPLLLAVMEKMNIADLLDKHFPMHGNWRGLSFGHVVVVWIAYILSEGDHRLSSVQGWTAGILMTLSLCLKNNKLRELDFSDDKLALVADCLGKDVEWETYSTVQTSKNIRVYDLRPKRVRLDSSTAKSYTSVTEDGLFQFGHSKEHRPDLPQLKIKMSVLDPLGMPLTMTIVSGNCADDPLYVPEIRKVQACVQQSGLLYVGDNKMSSLETRAYLASHNDYYLSPLSAVQMPATALQTLLEPVWNNTQTLESVYRPLENETDKPIHIADGFSYTVTLNAISEGKNVEWQEQRLVIHSLKHAESQEKALNERLKKARKEIEKLNVRGRGRKSLNEAETRQAVDAILSRYNVSNLLIIQYDIKTESVHKRAYGERPAQTIQLTTVNVRVSTDTTAYANTVRNFGWRVFVCNDMNLSLSEAVLAYRDQYIVERGFNRFRGKLLGITPLFLSSSTRIKGLIRLLSLALSVLCLVEYTVRKSLQEQDEKLNGIYAGNPKRATAKPTTEMMLRVFCGLTLTLITIQGVNQLHLTPLNAVQTRILYLLGIPVSCYQNLGSGIKMGEP